MAGKVAVVFCVALLGAPLAAVAASTPPASAPAAAAAQAATDAKAWLSQANAILAKTGDARDVGAAVDLLTRAVAAGNTTAMRVLATLLAKGDGVAADPDRAEALIKQAIAAGDTKAGYEALGDFYRLGTPPRDPARAIDAYLQAAETGNTSAMRKVAMLIARGDGAPADPVRAEKYLKQAVAAGDTKWGNENLGDLYAMATPLADPVKEAAAYQVAADAGETGAMRKLAALLAHGAAGVPIDGARAEALLVKAVAAGDIKGSNESLGDLYLADTPVKDGSKAIAAYQAAADAGDTGAMHKLAALYLAGVVVAGDPGHAETLLKQAAAAGDRYGWDALGDLYRAPTPLLDTAKAADAYQHAADLGVTGSGRKLMTMLANGDGVAADPTSARAIAQKVIAGGDAKNGYDMLGDFYRLYTPLMNGGDAAAAYQQAANAGNTGSMRKLAAMLGHGDGVPADVPRAEALLQQDIAAGDVKGGNESLGDLRRSVTPPDMAGAIAAYQTAADAGDTSAMRKLAALLITKTPGVQLDPKRAESLIQQVIAAGDIANGYGSLGDLYAAKTPANDPAKAIDAYQKAAAAGNTGAVLRLAAAHLNGALGKSSSPAKGVALLKQAIADNIPGAAVALANAYVYGAGVAKEPGTAVRILSAAASGGDVPAARRLIGLYSASTPPQGIARSLTKATTLLTAIESKLTPDIKALEELALQAARASSRDARQAVLAKFDTFEGSARSTAATRIYQVNPDAYVFIAQTLLARHGLYDGPSNGVFNAGTVRAMGKICRRPDVGNACRWGPLNGAAIAVMARLL